LQDPRLFRRWALVGAKRALDCTLSKLTEVAFIVKRQPDVLIQVRWCKVNRLRRGTKTVFAEIAMKVSHTRWSLLGLVLMMASLPGFAQTVTGTLQGRVFDTTGAAIPAANVTVADSSTGLTRTATASAMGDYQFTSLPAGDYMITAEKGGFRKLAKKVHLDIGGTGNVDFNLAVGEIVEQVTVQDVGEVAEPTRTMVSSVIDEQKIENLPVNGRQFIDFALLAPAVTIGDTTSGSTDVIIEPVTKLSFAGQNIHYNFVAIDGADNMSTASGIQKTTPSQDAVQEFRVVNSSYGTEFGRAVGGIVNIITKSGTNNLHGSAYEYFRNDKMDAKSALAAGFNKLRQNQFGVTLGGPIIKDKTFFFTNYEGQRHSESPFYNSIVLANINAINNVKVNIFGLPAENLFVNRTINYDNFLGKVDHRFSNSQSLSARYFFNDQRSTNLSPLNDGFDLPSGFKNNNFRDQSLVASLNSVFSGSLVNELRMQYAHRFFDFPVVSTQPHLEVSNTFTMGVNRGNPDFYEEGRWEIGDTITKTAGRHTISFGGNFNHVNTTESFPLFYPFEADFASLAAFLGTDGQAPGPHPFVIFMERFDAASNFSEPSIPTSVYQGGAISSTVRNQAKGELGHTYEGLFFQDKWRATSNLTLDYGLRWEGETWPSKALNNVTKNFDPRAGFSYALGTSRSIVIRGGAGLFHGTIPSPLLMCQIPSCGGTIGQYPGRENKEDSLAATTRLLAFASAPFITNFALNSLLGNPNVGPPAANGLYPDATPAAFLGCPSGFLASCGFFGDSVIARFAKDHKPPYGAQASLGVEFQPFRDAVLDITGLHVRGVHLGSFWNVNQPPPTCQITAHDSEGRTGPKNDYHIPLTPVCGSPANFLPGTGQPTVAVYFEADSKWDSQWDGLLINFNKRTSHHVGFGLSYTWSKGIDNGPNPSFVLIPQDSCCFGKERALSSDSVSQRFVGNFILTGPTHKNAIINGWQLSSIVTLETPHYFTKFAGSDTNGDVFGNNDRVGIEPRNTFKGDSYQTVDMRLSRTFKITEKTHLEAIAEGFNLLNTLNVHFFNTAYGAADFCPFNPAAAGCSATPSGFREGSPNASYGTPRSIFNPRQIQLALRLTW